MKCRILFAEDPKLASGSWLLEQGPMDGTLEDLWSLADVLTKLSITAKVACIIWLPAEVQ